MYFEYSDKKIILINETGKIELERKEILELHYKVSRVIDIIVNIEDKE